MQMSHNEPGSGSYPGRNTRQWGVAGPSHWLVDLLIGESGRGGDFVEVSG